MYTLDGFRKAKAAGGFTLIELMIAIAIVGVLAAIAVPQFTSYLARARVSEAVNYAQSCKTGYVEFYASRGTFPVNIADSGCTNISTDNIASVSIGGGNRPAIYVTLVDRAPLPAAIRNHVIVLQPLGSNNQLATEGNNINAWRCSLVVAGGAAAGTAAMDLVPASCRQTWL